MNHKVTLRKDFHGPTSISFIPPVSEISSLNLQRLIDALEELKGHVAKFGADGNLTPITISLITD